MPVEASHPRDALTPHIMLRFPFPGIALSTFLFRPERSNSCTLWALSRVLQDARAFTVYHCYCHSWSSCEIKLFVSIHCARETILLRRNRISFPTVGLLMARRPSSTPSTSRDNPIFSTYPFHQAPPLPWISAARGPYPFSSSPRARGYQHVQNTYLMPASPAAGGRRASVDYRPTIKKSQGQVPACLVNASVTHCGNDQIYAFGGFDQYTDEGLHAWRTCACGWRVLTFAKFTIMFSG